MTVYWGRCARCGGSLVIGHVCPDLQREISPESAAVLEKIVKDAYAKIDAEQYAETAYPPSPETVEKVVSKTMREAGIRWTRDETLLAMADMTAKRSTCLRLQVGAVIALDGRILSTGYNGAPSKMEHCKPASCGPTKPCNRTIHAEANAIAFAARHGVALSGSIMYCTDSPCLECAKLIINAGIERVIYSRRYRDNAPLDYLLKAGVNSVHAKKP